MAATMSVADVKAAVRERDGNACVDCGMSDKRHRELYGCGLHVHRKTPGSVYTVDDCETLCTPCHGKKPKSQCGSQDRYRSGKSLFAWIPEPLFKALKQAAEHSRRPLTTEVEIALEKHVESLGLWPPSSPAGE